MRKGRIETRVDNLCLAPFWFSPLFGLLVIGLRKKSHHRHPRPSVCFCAYACPKQHCC